MFRLNRLIGLAIIGLATAGFVLGSMPANAAPTGTVNTASPANWYCC